MAARKRPPVAVSAVVATKRVWRSTLISVGTIRAVNGVAITPQVAGRVNAIMFNSGKTVSKGDILLRFEDAVERAELKEAKASLQLSAIELARGEALFGRGSFPKASLDKARAQRDVNAARVERIQAQIERKQIKAPFAGRLGIRKVDLGQYLSAGTEIVTLQDLSSVFVNFSLPERDLPKIATGHQVTVSVDGFPGRKFSGTVTSIDARVEQTTRNILVQAELGNPGQALLPGMFAHVTVTLPEQHERIALPQTAVTYSLYGDSVFVIVAASTPAPGGGKAAPVVQRRFIRVGAREGSDIAVISGVKAGELVVSSGQIKLRNGARVSVNNTVKLDPPSPRPRP